LRDQLEASREKADKLSTVNSQTTTTATTIYLNQFNQSTSASSTTDPIITTESTITPTTQSNGKSTDSVTTDLVTLPDIVTVSSVVEESGDLTTVTSNLFSNNRSTIELTSTINSVIDGATTTLSTPQSTLNTGENTDSVTGKPPKELSDLLDKLLLTTTLPSIATFDTTIDTIEAHTNNTTIAVDVTSEAVGDSALNTTSVAERLTSTVSPSKVNRPHEDDCDLESALGNSKDGQNSSKILNANDSIKVKEPHLNLTSNRDTLIGVTDTPSDTSTSLLLSTTSAPFDTGSIHLRPIETDQTDVIAQVSDSAIHRRPTVPQLQQLVYETVSATSAVNPRKRTSNTRRKAADNASSARKRPLPAGSTRLSSFHSPIRSQSTGKHRHRSNRPASIRKQPQSTSSIDHFVLPIKHSAKHKLWLPRTQDSRPIRAHKANANQVWQQLIAKHLNHFDHHTRRHLQHHRRHHQHHLYKQYRRTLLGSNRHGLEWTLPATHDTHAFEPPTHTSRPSSVTSGSSLTTVVRNSQNACSDQSFARHPLDCNRFVRCVTSGDLLVTSVEFRCAPGLVFDERLSVCMWPHLTAPCLPSTAVFVEDPIEPDLFKVNAASLSVETNPNSNKIVSNDPIASSESQSGDSIAPSTSQSTVVTESSSPIDSSWIESNAPESPPILNGQPEAIVDRNLYFGESLMTPFLTHQVNDMLAIQPETPFDLEESPSSQSSVWTHFI
jgi:hypothetical protein